MALSKLFEAGEDCPGTDISPSLGTCGSTADFSNTLVPVGLALHSWQGGSHSHLSSVAVALQEMCWPAVYLHRSQILLLGALVLPP